MIFETVESKFGVCFSWQAVENLNPGRLDFMDYQGFPDSATYRIWILQLKT